MGRYFCLEQVWVQLWLDLFRFRPVTEELFQYAMITSCLRTWYFKNGNGKLGGVKPEMLEIGLGKMLESDSHSSVRAQTPTQCHRVSQLHKYGT